MNSKKKQHWVVPLLCCLFAGSSSAQSSQTPQSVYDNQNRLSEIKSIQPLDNMGGGKVVLSGTVTEVEADYPDARFTLKNSKDENYINVDTEALSMADRSNLFGTLVVVGQRVKVNCSIAGSGGFLYAIDIKKLPKLVTPTPSPKPTIAAAVTPIQSASTQSNSSYPLILLIILIVVGVGIVGLILFKGFRDANIEAEGNVRDAEQVKEPLSSIQQVTSLKTNFCPSCGAARSNDAQFCSSCGQQFESKVISSKATKKGGGFRSLVIVMGGGIAAVFAVIWLTSGDYRYQAQIEERSNKMVNEIADENIRKSFDDFEAFALKVKSRRLFEELRELRFQYEDSKDDPVKMEKYWQRVELMRNDIKNGRY